MLKDKIIEIFVQVDDFCKEIMPETEKQLIGTILWANATGKPDSATLK
ncbi:MAG: hypothetical protein PGN18_09025 [Pedobacter terrae]